MTISKEGGHFVVRSKTGRSLGTIVKEGNQYVARSKTGKNLGASPTMEGAQKRLAEVEAFKRQARQARQARLPRERRRGLLNG